MDVWGSIGMTFSPNFSMRSCCSVSKIPVAWLTCDSGFRVSGLGFRASGFGHQISYTNQFSVISFFFRSSCSSMCEIPVTYFAWGFQVPGINVRVLGCGHQFFFRVSGFNFESLLCRVNHNSRNRGKYFNSGGWWHSTSLIRNRPTPRVDGWGLTLRPSMRPADPSLNLQVWGLEFGSKSNVQGLGFGVWGLGFRVWGLGFRVWGLEFRI